MTMNTQGSDETGRRTNGWWRTSWKAGCVLAGGVVLAAVQAQEPTPAPAAAQAAPATALNLKGLLPPAPPEGLMNTLLGLPESWAKWADGVAADLNKLYGETPEDLAAQQALLERLQVRMKTIASALGDSQYAPIHPALRSLQGGLQRRLDVIAALQGSAGSDAATYSEQAGALIQGLEKFEATGSTESAHAVRQSFDALRRNATDGGDLISTTLRRNYFNYNLQVSVTEGFLNRVFCKQQTEEGAVIDCILGADVYGSQVTSSSATFDLVPAAPGHVRFNIVLNGTVNSSTEGTKRGATIYTDGFHTFFATKEVDFDGKAFTTFPALISVNASNTPTHATTRHQHVPLLGAFAEMAAFNAAMRKRPQTEAIAADRVATRVTPRFDEEVDSNFGKMNTKLTEKIEQPFTEMQLFPDIRVFNSTDTTIEMSTRLMGTNELSGSAGPSVGLTDGEVLIRLHETAVNAFLDRLGVQGQTMTEDDLRKLIEEKLSKLLNKDVSLAKAKADAAEDAETAPRAFIFSDVDPLRVQFGNGQMQLILRAGFKRENDDIPPQIVTIPLMIKLEGEEVVIDRGDVLVDPQEAPANVAEQVARAGVIKRKIENSIPSKRDTRTITLHKDSGDVNVSITGLTFEDGWLVLRVQ